jgi:DNA primase catalytic subunit
MAIETTAKLYEELMGIFSNMKIVYSGRGFHIHVFDEDVYGWSHKKRKEFAEKIKKKGFPIDEWVTSGDMRLIRLPHSLHGMVSRIVTPLDIKQLSSFDPIRDDRCMPKFLKPAGSNLS